MAVQSSHCSSDRLEMYVNDELADEVASQVEQHVGACETCQRRLESLVADESWWCRARQMLSGTFPAGAEGAGDRRLEEAIHGDEGPDVDVTDVDVPSLEFLAPTDDPEKLGRLGPYEISGVIGQGGMGIVLKGFDPALDRSLAIKVLAPQLATSGAARRRFAQEARAAAAVDHEHVVAIHAVDSRGALPYFVMPLIRGESLQKRIDRAGPLRIKETLRIGMQIAAGLAAAHAQGLVHRDIKPANILLEDGVERVKITDFGLARAVDDAGVTRSGVIAGTPQYMSPEQAEGRSIDQRTDLFSLGCVIYAMCTGHSPFRAETTMAVLRRICVDTPRAIQDINPEIPHWMQRIVDKLLARDPAQRLQSATEVSELLGRCLAHLQQPATVALPAGVNTGRDVERSAGRRRRLLVAAVAAFVLLAGVTAVSVAVLQYAEKPKSKEARPGAEPPDSAPLAATRRADLVDRSPDGPAVDVASPQTGADDTVEHTWAPVVDKLPMITAEVGALSLDNHVGPAAGSRSADEVLSNIELQLEVIKQGIERDWP